MKIKTDFVTNSSSTAFVVAWPIRIRMLRDVTDYVSPANKAKQVYKDAISQPGKIIKPTKAIYREIYSPLSDDYGSVYDRYKRIADREAVTEHDIIMNGQWSSIAWEEQRKIVENKATERTHAFIEKTEGHYLYHFEYGDEDGSFMGEMEHGGTFILLPHIAISKH